LESLDYSLGADGVEYRIECVTRHLRRNQHTLDGFMTYGDVVLLTCELGASLAGGENISFSVKADDARETFVNFILASEIDSQKTLLWP
jgi:hypothetical protein